MNKQVVFCPQMDSVLFAEFLMWKEHPGLDRSSAFMSRIYKEDIGPCLSFTRSEVRISLRMLCLPLFCILKGKEINLPKMEFHAFPRRLSSRRQLVPTMLTQFLRHTEPHSSSC